MKLALSSRAFDPLLRSGALTQLEWLERCAHAFDVDGVAFDLAHFPRRDHEYLAQLKKMAVDGGLSIAALEARDFLAGADDEARAAIVAEAASLGAPLIVCTLPVPSETPAAGYNEAVRAGKLATRVAKSANIVLAVRNVAQTLGADAAGLRRYAKDVDSAWLRFALDLDGLPEEDRELLEPRAVIAYASDFFGSLAGLRAFVCAQYDGNDVEKELPALLERARRELFEGRQPHMPSSYLV